MFLRAALRAAMCANRTQRTLDGPPKQLVAYTARIKHLIQRHDINGALGILRSLKQQGMTPDIVTFTTILQHFVETKDVEGANSVLQDMFSHNIHPDLRVYNSMMKLLVSKGEVDGAREILNSISAAGLSPNHVTYTTLMQYYIERCDDRGARAVMREMESHNIRPDAATFDSLVKLAINSQSQSQQQQGRVVDGGNDNVFGVNAGLELIDEIVASGITPHPITYTRFVTQFVNQGQTMLALRVLHQAMRTDGVRMDAVPFSILIPRLFDAKEFRKATELIQSIQLPEPEWNRLLTVLIQQKRLSEARVVLEACVAAGHQLRTGMCSNFIGTLCRFQRLDDAENLLKFLTTSTAKLNRQVFFDVMRLYCGNKRFDEALHLFFDVMINRFVIGLRSFNVALDIFAHHQHREGISRLLQTMCRDAKECPTQETFAILMSGFRDLPSRRAMKEVKSSLLSVGIPKQLVHELGEKYLLAQMRLQQYRSHQPRSQREFVLDRGKDDES
jgi:pentatricopeptide repeat protein